MVHDLDEGICPSALTVRILNGRHVKAQECLGAKVQIQRQTLRKLPTRDIPAGGRTDHLNGDREDSRQKEK